MSLIVAESLEMAWCGLEVPHPEWIGGGGIRIPAVQEWETTPDDAPTIPYDLSTPPDDAETTADDLGLRPDVCPRVLAEARRRLTTGDDAWTRRDPPPGSTYDGSRRQTTPEGIPWGYLLSLWSPGDTWRSVAVRAGVPGVG